MSAVGVEGLSPGLPPGVEAQFASCEATVERVRSSPNTYLVRLRGLPIATYSAEGVGFVDVEVGRMWMGLVHYQRWAQIVYNDTSRAGAQMRREIRKNMLGLNLILGQAAKAGFAVREKGAGLNRVYYLSHVDFGEVAQMIVVRGTREVAAVKFASQSQFRVFALLDELAGYLKPGQSPA